MGFMKKMVKKVLCNLRSSTRKRTSAETEQTGFEENKKESQMSSDPKAMVEKPTHEWRKRGKNIGQDQGAYGQELNKNKYRATPMVNEGFENGKKTGTAYSSMLEGKGNSKRLAQHVNTSQSTERIWKNVNGNLKSEERKKEGKMKIDKLVFRRKLEEEREREREKDRNAVERATREVTERVYAESPEREAVDRESAEARRRLMAVTQEILDKKCAEAREKLSAENASLKARIRAEQTAVENPTAETPEHVVEKRKAKKAAFEASERAERSDSSSAARDTYSSAHAASVGNFEGVEGESAQRCNSRLERQQTQIRECAAKALAEKKKRDRQAEREQAERDSFADSVDAEVKKWSSRKDLPALISTLQYILWTNSGWEPIPLKDVKTANAVNKAYRKALLLVHPDKLQHNATIKQKYIGEKVFYLLKEAWNKFNSGAQ